MDLLPGRVMSVSNPDDSFSTLKGSASAEVSVVSDMVGIAGNVGNVMKKQTEK